jgi:hypothetical protein
LVERRTTKNLSFAQKTLPFLRKKISKISKKLRILEIFFWKVVLQACVLKKRILEQKMCVQSLKELPQI